MWLARSFRPGGRSEEWRDRALRCQGIRTTLVQKAVECALAARQAAVPFNQGRPASNQVLCLVEMAVNDFNARIGLAQCHELVC